MSKISQNPASNDAAKWDTGGYWRFLRDHGETGPMDDPRLALMASCVANQQRFAGFSEVIDIREVKCPVCRAPGFNTGMGAWVHTCGAEYLSDGETAEPCPQEAG